jgi:hypothetical protein
MQESQVFSPEGFSLSPTDLIDPDMDEDEPSNEADARDGRYRQFAKAIDRDDLKQADGPRPAPGIRGLRGGH